MRKTLDIFELILLTVIFLSGVITSEWHYCYISLLILIAYTLFDIQRENKKK